MDAGRGVGSGEGTAMGNAAELMKALKVADSVSFAVPVVAERVRTFVGIRNYESLVVLINNCGRWGLHSS
jgi:hypothetical protein